MNSRRSSAFRTVCWLFALLQLGFPLASAVADAQARGARADAQVHFESERCAPSHPGDCAHCATTRGAAPVAGVFQPTFLASVVRHAAPLEPARPTGALVASSPLPRAPPSLS